MSNTILITTLLLAIILVIPIVCRRLRIPAIIGLILTGMCVGPSGLGILERTETIDVLGQIGILYIMFLSGIEIDIDDFRHERKRGFLFGVLTFFIPLLLGFFTFTTLGMNVWSSLLAASILGSHTLMTYTCVSRYSIHKNAAVSITIGGTIIAVTAAMIILALVSGYFHGFSGQLFALRFSLGTIAMVAIVFGAMPRLIKWCFHRTNDPIQQWLLVMTMAVSGGLLAYGAGLEPILGVFLTALALNRQIPNVSPLMNRITFAGNALFIPIFLVGVGMLIDVRAFVQGWQSLVYAAVMVAMAIGSKWLAAALTQWICHLTAQQRKLMFGLTNSHAAGALASVMIGYNLLLPDGTRLLNDTILNAVIILILISCAISSFVTEKAAEVLHEEAVLADDSREDDIMTLLPSVRTRDNRRPKDLVNFLTESRNKIPLEDRVKHLVLNFPDTSIISQQGTVDNILKTYGLAVWQCHLRQALTSFKTVRVLMPKNADADPGYRIWQQFLEKLVEQMKADVTQETISDWKILPRIQQSMTENELLIIIQARPRTPAYNPELETVPTIMRQHFQHRSFVLLFPAQQPADVEANELIQEVKTDATNTFSFIRRLRLKIK